MDYTFLEYLWAGVFPFYIDLFFELVTIVTVHRANGIVSPLSGRWSSVHVSTPRPERSFSARTKETDNGYKFLSANQIHHKKYYTGRLRFWLISHLMLQVLGGGWPKQLAETQIVCFACGKEIVWSTAASLIDHHRQPKSLLGKEDPEERPCDHFSELLDCWKKIGE